MLESTYQAKLIQKLRERFSGCVILKNDSGYLQGIPDLLFLCGGFWAMLEVKRSENEPYQPNQEIYLEMLNGMSFAATIYPSNEEEIFRALEDALESHYRDTRNSRRQ